MYMSVVITLSPAEKDADWKSRVCVLHLEDNESDHELIVTALAKGNLTCDFVRCVSREEFEGLLKSVVFDLILSDYTLPSYDGMAALSVAQKLQPDTPFIFVSGTIGEERAVESLKSGAVDYVLKDRLGGLVAAAKRALRDAHQQRECVRLEVKLRQAQKMEAVGRLAGGVAHDFNNILAVIRGNVELVLMADTDLDSHTRENLGDVVAATERATNLIRQLFALGQKQVMQPMPIRLNDVIENLLRMLRRVIGEDVHLEWKPDAQLPYVAADIGMMEQVILNLVLNARDAMPKGGCLLLSTERVFIDEAHPRPAPEARSGEFVCCTVSDEGTGIASEHLPHIFEPFFTTKDTGKGTGLGLATAYGIVKQHNGWMEVQTCVGVGSTFQMFIPIAAPPVILESPESTRSSLRGGNERILLVEDDPSVCLTTRRILEAYGYEVVSASSGRDVLNSPRYITTGFNLLLTDLVLPGGVSGQELEKELQRENPGLKAIFVSGHAYGTAATDTDLIRRDQAGCFLQKPYSSQQLLKAVRKALDGNKADNGD